MSHRSRRVMGVAACVAAVLLASGADARRRSRPASRPPWKARDAALVLDPFHGNRVDLARVARNPHVVGIIHKATEGTTFVDPACAARREEAARHGLLWGSYHFGRPGDVAAQVDAYLAAAQPGPADVVALDVDGIGSEHMSLADAASFVETVNERLGRYPLLYASREVLAQPMTQAVRASLARCPLWFVRYRDRPLGVPRDTWPHGQVLWQFSSEIRPVCRIRGADRRTDVNLYNGSLSDVRRAWPFTTATRR